MIIALKMCLLVVGLIKFVPVFGVLGQDKIEEAYTVTLSTPDLSILMLHRALLFGILGGFILLSVFIEKYQIAAMCMAAISLLGFVLICHSVGGYNASIAKVLIIDYIGIAFLVAAGVLKVMAGSGSASV